MHLWPIMIQFNELRALFGYVAQLTWVLKCLKTVKLTIFYEKMENDPYNGKGITVSGCLEEIED